jgi:hypothetical protein
MSAEASPFFLAFDLCRWLEGRRQAARQAIEEWDPEQLLAVAAADVVDYLMAQYSVVCPVLHRDQITQLPVSEVDVNRAAPPGWGDALPTTRRSPAESRRTRAVINVRFDGDHDVFALRPSKYRPDVPSGYLYYPDILELTWTSDHPGSGDPAVVRQYFDAQLDKIDEFLSWARHDIEHHNAALRTVITTSIAQRRAKQLADRELEAGLGFPVWPPQETAEYPVPLEPESVLPEIQYEQALDVLRNARNQLERSPLMTAHLDEEEIRDLLLVFLNAHFKGAAAGEVFKASGKTDILIRVEDRNVFIAECKIWNGPKTIRGALTQLLGYLVWRDTKAALLVFIRRGQPTAVIDKAVLEITKHPNFTRTHGPSQDGERYDFVLHANGDRSQEIRLAFMPFALQDNRDSDER